MKGYIKRLSQDIEKLEAKRQALAVFLVNPRESINNKQYELLCKQRNLMNQLLDVMKQRLTYEQEIHPDYFEDLDVDVAIAKQSESLEQLGNEVEESAFALIRSCEKASEE